MQEHVCASYATLRALLVIRFPLDIPNPDDILNSGLVQPRPVSTQASFKFAITKLCSED